MKTLKTGVKDYVAIKRAMGFSFERQAADLNRFCAFMKKLKQKYITAELAKKWALAGKKMPTWRHARQISVLHAFALYWRTIEPRTQLWPENLWPLRYQRKNPHIYNDDEIKLLLAECLKLKPLESLRPKMFYTLFGLIAACGFRLSEALMLTDSDVDLKNGVITIKRTKFNKTRVVPVHETTRQALKEYLDVRDGYREKYRYGRSRLNLFFVTNDETPINTEMADWTFDQIALKCGVRTQSRRGPRLHDLRHTFVVRTLENWYREGKDVEALLYVLSTYVGHSHPGSTFWYITITPELMALARDRLDLYMGGLSK